jgi:hypothetical protein
MKQAFSLTPRFSEVNGGRGGILNRFTGFSGLHEPAVGASRGEQWRQPSSDCAANESNYLLDNVIEIV